LPGVVQCDFPSAPVRRSREFLGVSFRLMNFGGEFARDDRFDARQTLAEALGDDVLTAHAVLPLCLLKSVDAAPARPRGAPRASTRSTAGRIPASTSWCRPLAPPRSRCRGILFDQPAVVVEAHDGRLERVGGDFFTDVPVQANAYVMRWILHDWSDEQSVGLLTNVRRAATPDARLMVVESVIPETSEFDMVSGWT
jgi:hypothetical protein